MRAPWRSAGLALGTASALGLARFGHGLFIPAMRERLGWTLAEAGGLTTANSVGYLLGAAVAAGAARRAGPTATFRAGMLLTAASLGATAGTDRFPLLLAARALGGLGGALVFIAGAVLAAALGRATRSIAPVTVYYGGTGLGVVLTGGTVPVLLDGHPERWPLGWALLAVAAALAAAASWRAADGGTGAPATPPASRPRKGSTQWRLSLVYVMFGAGYIAYMTFLSTYLAARSASLGLVCLTWAVLGLSAVAAPALWSRPIAAWPGTRALAALLATVAVAAALPLLSAAPLAVGGSAVLFGSAFMMVPAAVTALAAAARPPGEATGLIAALTVVFAIGQSAGPWASGWLADRTGAAAALWWASALCASAALLAAPPGAARSAAQGVARDAARDAAQGAAAGTVPARPSAPAA